MNENKELSGQIKTQVEGIAERVAHEVLGQTVLCTTCQTVSKLVGQPVGCVKKAVQRDEHRANFLWDFEKGSIERLGYEFANGLTEAYRKQTWDILMAAIREDEAAKHR